MSYYVSPVNDHSESFGCECLNEYPRNQQTKFITENFLNLQIFFSLILTKLRALFVSDLGKFLWASECCACNIFMLTSVLTRPKHRGISVFHPFVFFSTL